MKLISRTNRGAAGAKALCRLAVLLSLFCGVVAPVAKAQGSSAILLDTANAFWRERAPAVFRARFETTRGSFVIEAHRDWAPNGVDRFYNLVRAGFFDDSRFYRIRPRWAQFGIAGDPRVSAVWRDHRIKDDPVVKSNLRTYVSYAFAVPDGRTTQVYVNLIDRADQDSLGFTPFGRVVEGMQVVDSLYAGYGESSGGGIRAGKQAPLFEGGNAYLDKNYPLLDRLIKARIE
jgi:peptidyl-prolyl cis-trans isomerase A (cyclophilin A)